MDRPGIHRREHMLAEDRALLDRLRRADPTELRRPIGGHHDQRHPIEVGLHHASEELSCRRAGRDQHQHGTHRRAGQTKSHEAGGALIEPDVHAQRAGGEGQGQRC